MELRVQNAVRTGVLPGAADIFLLKSRNLEAPIIFRTSRRVGSEKLSTPAYYGIDGRKYKFRFLRRYKFSPVAAISPSARLIAVALLDGQTLIMKDLPAPTELTFTVQSPVPPNSISIIPPVGEDAALKILTPGQKHLRNVVKLQRREQTDGKKKYPDRLWVNESGTILVALQEHQLWTWQPTEWKSFPHAVSDDVEVQLWREGGQVWSVEPQDGGPCVMRSWDLLTGDQITARQGPAGTVTAFSVHASRPIVALATTGPSLSDIATTIVHLDRGTFTTIALGCMTAQKLGVAAGSNKAGLHAVSALQWAGDALFILTRAGELAVSPLFQHPAPLSVTNVSHKVAATGAIAAPITAEHGFLVDVLQTMLGGAGGERDANGPIRMRVPPDYGDPDRITLLAANDIDVVMLEVATTTRPTLLRDSLGYVTRLDYTLAWPGLLGLLLEMQARTPARDLALLPMTGVDCEFTQTAEAVLGLGTLPAVTAVATALARVLESGRSRITPLGLPLVVVDRIVAKLTTDVRIGLKDGVLTPIDAAIVFKAITQVGRDAVAVFGAQQRLLASIRAWADNVTGIARTRALCHATHMARCLDARPVTAPCYGPVPDDRLDRDVEKGVGAAVTARLVNAVAAEDIKKAGELVFSRVLSLSRSEFHALCVAVRASSDTPSAPCPAVYEGALPAMQVFVATVSGLFARKPVRVPLPNRTRPAAAIQCGRLRMALTGKTHDLIIWASTASVAISMAVLRTPPLRMAKAMVRLMPECWKEVLTVLLWARSNQAGWGVVYGPELAGDVDAAILFLREHGQTAGLPDYGPTMPSPGKTVGPLMPEQPVDAMTSPMVSFEDQHPAAPAAALAFNRTMPVFLPTLLRGQQVRLDTRKKSASSVEGLAVPSLSRGAHRAGSGAVPALLRPRDRGIVQDTEPLVQKVQAEPVTMTTGLPKKAVKVPRVEPAQHERARPVASYVPAFGHRLPDSNQYVRTRAGRPHGQLQHPGGSPTPKVTVMPLRTVVESVEDGSGPAEVERISASGPAEQSPKSGPMPETLPVVPEPAPTPALRKPESVSPVREPRLDESFVVTGVQDVPPPRYTFPKPKPVRTEPLYAKPRPALRSAELGFEAKRSLGHLRDRLDMLIPQDVRIGGSGSGLKPLREMSNAELQAHLEYLKTHGPEPV
ncbi:hypothetical protein J8273_8247 [Carpediemonas membranifera]|uniref:Uncharacterized protein n=1 Tax=Carpediemonas membranifera TaxID=201153 RepID=A0A8J6B529_9EUKA|nr:hypothetical protein J8273_8247 [Carpediemonas membranifera]|eukprot:KAG9390207.1 hypothetical protein J8273_8247 [Carpediemonas membranifera]